MKPKSLTTLAALVVIGIGGFMAGRNSSAPSPDSGTTASSGSSQGRPERSTARDSATEVARKARTERESKTSTTGRLAKLEAIVRGENPLERNRALLALIDQMGPGDFEDAVARFRSLGITDERSAEYALLLSAWAQADPLTALAYAKKNTQGDFATSTILTTWASTDPEAAIRWATANHQGDGANPYMPGIIRGLASSDPARATELLASMPKSTERGEALDFMVPHLLQQGPEATKAWIAAIRDDSLRNGAMLRTAETLADADPAGTAAWLLANPGQAAQRRLDNVYRVWAKQDQRAALSSFNSLPAGEERSNALRGVISSVANQNPQAATSLMDRYPNDVTDKVVEYFVWHSFDSDPSAAINAIGRIADQDQRDRMYRRTLNYWNDRDPAAASAWAAQNPGAANHLPAR
ncbi:MAG: hypothetical protein ORN51_02030 [Akkermansiaceae bacterium]|nr:hypothetical protein [Akkermansiaceae bacterium]